MPQNIGCWINSVDVMLVIVVHSCITCLSSWVSFYVGSTSVVWSTQAKGMFASDYFLEESFKVCTERQRSHQNIGSEAGKGGRKSQNRSLLPRWLHG